MSKLSKAFMLCAIFYIILGMLVGLKMAASQDFVQTPVHAHLNLMGWVSMMLFGLYYTVVSSSVEGLLPKIHFGLSNIGMLLVALGLFLLHSGNPDAEILAIVGSISFFLSILVFGWVVIRTK